MGDSKASDHSTGLEIAIVGMAGRFPGARNIDEFWKNLCDGVESMSFFSDEELAASGLDQDVIGHPDYVKAAGVLDDAELFDASFFGFSPKESEIMDPQHRVFLECAWEALEQAGYYSEAYAGLVGVYAGVSANTYLISNLCSNLGMKSLGDFRGLIGNDKDHLSTRVSYKLNLKGPSVAVQSACSTSLVAVHMACQGLLAGECDMALAGGVSVSVPQRRGYLYQKEGILSPDGHCRAFDAGAQGTVPGNGVGIVVLKRLADAVDDGDSILAVIKGSSVNNDGAQKVGYTAPSVDGQSVVISTAQAMARIDLETISYIEAHGTGTSLGDPIEMAALAQAFRGTREKRFCAIGSVKTNIGHLDAAAGVAGLIKTVLMLKHKILPPSLHFEKPNPQIDFTESPFYVNTRLSEWKAGSGPRRAGVSSFGLGGTNAHVVLEEAPESEPSGASRPHQLILLSAKTEDALEAATHNLAERLDHHPDQNLADLSYTLQRGRKAFDHRRVVVCTDVADAADVLRTRDPRRMLSYVTTLRDRPVAFIFPGLGDHYVNMGLGLYNSYPAFRSEVDRCCRLLTPHLGFDLLGLLYPRSGAGPQAAGGNGGGGQAKPDLRRMLGRVPREGEGARLEGERLESEGLSRTVAAQPAVFVVEYALARLLMSWGVEPEAMIGYSLGEYVAACLAGVMKLEDALYLVARRAGLIERLPGGGMLAVAASEREIEGMLAGGVSVAAVNGPGMCVVAGEESGVRRMEEELTARGVVSKRLATRHAFHSGMMEEIREEYEGVVREVELSAPTRRYVSNVSGDWVGGEEVREAGYWARHMCEAVRYGEGMEKVLEGGERIVVEVGPGQVLSSLVVQQGREGVMAVATMRSMYEGSEDDARYLETGVGRIWLGGGKVDWEGYHSGEKRRRVALPTYPFQRQRYWLESSKRPDHLDTHQSSLDKKPDVADWFYMPYWKPSPSASSLSAAQSGKQARQWLVFMDDCGAGRRIIEKLEQANNNVLAIVAGPKFHRLSERVYSINPRERDDYTALISELRASGRIPDRIVHLWMLTPDEDVEPREDAYEKTQALGFYSLMFLAQALGENNISDQLQIFLISNGMHKVTCAEIVSPLKATALGPCKVIPQEYPNVSCSAIDIALPPDNSVQRERLITQLLGEFGNSPTDSAIAYRDNARWVRHFEPVRVERQPIENTGLREAGVYVITGGLGGLGLALAEHLAGSVRAKLVLINRSGLPPKEEWDQLLSSDDGQDRLSARIKKVKALEEMGAEVLVVRADVSNEQEMLAAIGQGRERFGRINGVIHTAGVPGAGLIQLKTRQMVEDVFASKVKGALVLEQILRDEALDFIALYSANVSVIGGFGQVDYSAANAFLDAFAHSHSSRRGVPTVSIDWCAWQWDAWQESLMGAIPEVHAELKRMRETYGLTFEEGHDALGRALSTALPQVVVSTQDFKAVGEHHGKFGTPDFLRHLEKARESKSSHPRPALGTPYVAPRSDAERVIAEVWQALLGIEQVGVYDNFFELGGHSLLGIQLMSRLGEAFQVSPPLRSLFEKPTVAELSLLVEGMLIAEIEGLTEEEAKQIVSSEAVS